MVVVVIAFVVFMERALRKIHIQYPRRQVGMKVYDGGSSHLPIKVNPAGVIPAIFASSLLLLPVTVSTFSGSRRGRSCRRSGLFRAGPAALPAVLHGDDRVLHLLLHRQRVLQDRGRGREPEEPERLHSPASAPARRPRNTSTMWSTVS
jgi:preprotein translocase subunit SecY